MLADDEKGRHGDLAKPSPQVWLRSGPEVPEAPGQAVAGVRQPAGEIGSSDRQLREHRHRQPPLDEGGDAVAFDLDSDLLVGFDAERTLGGVDDASGGAEQDQVRRPPSTESGRHRETTTHRVAEQCKGSFDVLAEQLGSLGEVHLDAAAVAMPWHVEHDELVIAPELVAEVAPRGGSLSEAVAEHEARATADDRASKGGHRP